MPRKPVKRLGYHSTKKWKKRNDRQQIQQLSVARGETAPDIAEIQFESVADIDANPGCSHQDSPSVVSPFTAHMLAGEHTPPQTPAGAEGTETDRDRARVIDGINIVYKPERGVHNLKGINEGRGVVDMQHFVSEICEVANHMHMCWNCGYMEFVKAETQGLIETLTFRCAKCSTVKTVQTVQTTSNNVDPNLAAVWGFRSVGCGLDRLQEVTSIIGLNAISQNRYKACDRIVDNVMGEQLTLSIAEAAEAEKAYAIAKRKMYNGFPCCTVILDGGWSHRSYGHRYTSMSGVAVIIGKVTGKILFVGVKNKYCSICAIDKKTGQSRQHDCFLNYSGPSTAMEAALIAEGFNNSMDSLGLVFNEFVADGDSNVFSAIKRTKYGSIVKKIECSNHIVKNYTSRLYELKKKTMKKRLSGPRIKVMSKVARQMVSYRHNNNGTQAELIADFENIHLHAYGNHANCHIYYCNQVGQQLHDSMYREWFSDMQNLRMAADGLVLKSKHMLQDMTSNAAEMYMNILTKFTAGKQLFLNRRGTFTGRCKQAAVSYNIGGVQHHVSAMRSILGKHGCTPNKEIKKLAAKRVRIAVMRSRRCKAPRKKLVMSGSTDRHYGPQAEQPDMTNDEYAEAKERFFQNKLLVDTVKIEEDTRDQANSPLWHEVRQIRLGASEFGQICRMRHTTNTSRLVNAKKYQEFTGSRKVQEALSYGRINESVARAQYELEFGVKVQPNGVFVDNDDPFLCATPDGLIGSDGILEIKCPIRIRDMIPIDAAKKKKLYCSIDKNDKLKLKRTHPYYFQVQGQLHITKRKWCDFVVYTPLGMSCERIVVDHEFWQMKMFPRLEEFYYEALLPELIDPRVTRNMPIRDKKLRPLVEKKALQD